MTTNPEDPFVIMCPICMVAYRKSFWKNENDEMTPGYCFVCGEHLLPDINVYVEGAKPVSRQDERALVYVDKTTDSEVRRFSWDEIEASELAWKMHYTQISDPSS